MRTDEYRSTGRLPAQILATMIALPVLWLYGASGVGKTTVAWELFVQLAEAGIATGYVDIDQLGMCYAPPTPQHWAPEPDSDPGRHRLKARTLDAVAVNDQDAGVSCLIVPVVIDWDHAVLPRAEAPVRAAAGITAAEPDHRKSPPGPGWDRAVP